MRFHIDEEADLESHEVIDICSEFASEIGPSMSTEEVAELEKATRGQSANEVWMEARKGN